MNGPIGPDSQNIQNEKTTEEDMEYKVLNEPAMEDETQLVQKWMGDYIKIVGTKDSKSFLVQRSEISAFMAVLFRQDIHLFEWAKEPYLKFMKLKEFWLPEAPKFVNMIHDGLTIREIYMAYSNEANLVQVSDSRVREVEVHREFSRAANSSGSSSSSGFGRSFVGGLSGTQPRWQSFVQIPFSETKRNELRTLSRASATVNRKLAAVQGAKSSQSAKVERYFLATFHRVTRVVDIESQPMMGSGVGGWKDGVQWVEPPLEMVLRPIDFVIALSRNAIEVVDWRSAQPLQTLKIDS
ncbi:hypothetical protein HK405_002555, partial [Cladochytrium tenue]